MNTRDASATIPRTYREVMDAQSPTNVELADRLDQLADAITTRRDTTSLLSEFSMRVPAEPKRDADLVLSEAAKRLRAIDALLAEGSASSEGAEAARPAQVQDLTKFAAQTVVMQAGIIKISGDDAAVHQAVLELRKGMNGYVTDAAKRAQGEHEQRSSDGSERRPIADEVVVGALGVYTKDWCARPRELSDMRAALEWYESALPHGLPAGSDAGTIGEMTSRRAAYFMERFKRDEKMLGPNEQKALDYVIAMLATAEQPSFGQDARDATVTDLKALEREMRDHRIAIGHQSLTVLAWADRLSRAIAAQQRQGERT